MKLLISTLMLSLAFATYSTADTVCMPHSELKASLIDWYQERPVAAPSENQEQLWVSDGTGTWTMVKARADGTACVIAQGEDWIGERSQSQLLAELDS